MSRKLFKGTLIVGGVIATVTLLQSSAIWTPRTLAMSLVATAFQTQRTPPSLPARATDPAIVKVADGFLAAVLASDAHAVAATYREDAVEMPNGERPVAGRTAIEERYRQLFNAARFTNFKFSHIESTTRGDLAYDVGTYEMRLACQDGRVINDAGKYLVLMKRTDGAWKATYAIYNTDTMPAPR